jgi:hypothetical protein
MTAAGMPTDDAIPDDLARSDTAARADLAAAQRALVAALVEGGPLPPGFDALRVGAAARALLRKRAGEVGRAWPQLAAAYGAQWPSVFAEWARHRPTRGSWLDGWDFARSHPEPRSSSAALELALCEAEWRYDGETAPRRRRMCVIRVRGVVVVRAFGRTRVRTARQAWEGLS